LTTIITRENKLEKFMHKIQHMKSSTSEAKSLHRK